MFLAIIAIFKWVRLKSPLSLLFYPSLSYILFLQLYGECRGIEK